MLAAFPEMFPLMAEPGIELSAVTADDPFPNRYPDSDVAPVPPFATPKVPAKVIAPVVAKAGVRPVDPPLKLVTAKLVVACQLVAPVPSVVSTWPLDPAVLGRVMVQLDPFAKAFNPT